MRDNKTTLKMNELQQNESISWLIIWWNFVPYLSKSSKCKDWSFLFKGGWSVLIGRLSINITLKSLLLIVRTEKSSKWGAWLQNKMFFSITFYSFPSEYRNSKVLTRSNLKMTFSFAIIGSIAATTLKFVNNART